MPKLRRRRKRTGSKPKPKPVKRQKIAPLKKAARLRMKLRRQAKPRMLFKKVSYFIVYSLIGPSVLMMTVTFSFDLRWLDLTFLNFIFHFFF